MPTGLKMREAAEGATEESRVIEGCAVVFNQETILWDGKYERIRETIDPSCITAEFLAEQDIKLNLLHERENSLCRNNKGAGTLQLELREDGLYFSAEMPRCDLGERCLELVKNGTYTGCSFEFFTGAYDEEHTTLPDGREDILIRHTAFEKITALTIAMDPAYEQTSVSARECQKREADKDAEAARRETEEKAREEEENRRADEQAIIAEQERKMQAMYHRYF